jgi:hypothetical protein
MEAVGKIPDFSVGAGTVWWASKIEIFAVRGGSKSPVVTD